ncbi:MAG TPA: PH domain-containing protein [Bacteroidia bacterium]
MKVFKASAYPNVLLMYTLTMLPVTIYTFAHQFYFIAFFIFLIYITLIYIFNTITYIINEDTLIVKTSFLYKQSYKISNIKSITRDKNVNAHASGSQLLNINCGKQGRIGLYLTEHQNFTQTLLELKPDIELKTK